MDTEGVIFLQRMKAIEDERLEMYRRHWDYYRGQHKAMLPIRSGQPDDNVRINVTKVVVDQSVAFLFGKDVGFQLQEGEQTPEEEALAVCWRRNRKMTLLNEIGITGSLCGHVFVKLIPEYATDGEGTDRPIEWVRLVNIQPEYMSVRWNQQDVSEAEQFVIQWTEETEDGKALDRRQVIQKDDAGKWGLTHEIARGAQGWRADPDNPPIDWPWDWPPISHCQNLIAPSSFYGFSDLEGLELQDAINYVASKVQRITRYHAHPKSIGKGFNVNQLSQREDEMIVLPDPESDLWNLEMKSDLSGTMAYLDRLINWCMAVARIPRIDPAVINVGALSGFALRVLYGDLLRKTNVKRCTYGDMLTEINAHMLEMMGHGEELVTTLHWQDPLPSNPLESVEALLKERELGTVSKETAAVSLGRDWETEQERLANEAANEDTIGARMLRAFEQRPEAAQPR